MTVNTNTAVSSATSTSTGLINPATNSLLHSRSAEIAAGSASSTEALLAVVLQKLSDQDTRTAEYQAQQSKWASQITDFISRIAQLQSYIAQLEHKIRQHEGQSRRNAQVNTNASQLHSSRSTPIPAPVALSAATQSSTSSSHGQL
jgi:TolA-binding protein